MSLKSKLTTIKNRLLNILLWSVVSAAFIGPGTVTTATKAGATFGFDLLWALVFSTFACLLLQEAAARITIVSGFNLGQAIAKQFEGKSTRTLVLILIIGAIIVGCAAYQTGNILGAVAGIDLIFPQEKIEQSTSLKFLAEHFRQILVVIMGTFAFIALSLRSLQLIAKVMGIIVMFMGVAFFTTAFYLDPSPEALLRGSLIPTLPNETGAGLIVLGLIGTTVVPYDLFLGSGVLEKKQAVGEMRLGLSVAVILGGIISMAVLTVGTVVKGDFSYQGLAAALSENVGGIAIFIFGFGMFAAGFSSSITAPLASAITARSLFESKNPEKWKNQSKYFRTVWMAVLFIGILFGLADVEPIPAIILAQALNGLILPFISIFLLFVVNDPNLMGEKVNGWMSNLMLGVVVWVTLVLGMINVTKALNYAWEFALEKGITSFIVISLSALVASIWMMYKIYSDRNIKISDKEKLTSDSNEP